MIHPYKHGWYSGICNELGHVWKNQILGKKCSRCGKQKVQGEP